MADDAAYSTIDISDEEESEEEEDGSVDVSDDLMDTRNISAYWKEVIGAMTGTPTGWPLESYTGEDNTEFLTTKLQNKASDMNMIRVLSPNQYPYDIMYCLFVVKPIYTLRTCRDNMKGTYKETIAYLFNKLGLHSDFSRVVFTLATNTVLCHNSNNGNDKYKFVIYQINSESDIFHVELWQSLTNVPENNSLVSSLYMSWYLAMRDRTKALMLAKLDAVTEKVKTITELANHGSVRSQCVPTKKRDNDTDVRVTVVSDHQVTVGPHVQITCIQRPLQPDIEWAVQVLKADLENERTRQLYTHVLGKGTFGVVYDVTKNIVCKMVHNMCNRDTERNCMDSFEEAAITMALSKCNYITRLYYATLGVNTVNKSYTCYMFMERATLPLDVVFTRQESSQHNWLKPIVEHDTLQALAYMHKHGFVHRDVKFNNMLLFIQRGHVVIKLCDLSCSQLGYSANSRSGDMYRAAPEVLIYPLYSPASDMFSWAVTMWTMYTGAIPFYRTKYSFYSITRALFTIVGCYKNMAEYNGADLNIKGSDYLCGHNVCTLNSDEEFNKITKKLYRNYNGHKVPIALSPLLVTNMSIFPQRRYTAEYLLCHKRYTNIKGDLIHRTVLRREQLDCLSPMPGLLFDRESESMRAMLVERVPSARTVKICWSNKHKIYYGHEHYDITELVSSTDKFSTRAKAQAPKITYLTAAPADETYSQLVSLQPDDEDDQFSEARLVLNDVRMSVFGNAKEQIPSPGNQKQAPRTQKRHKISSPNSSSGSANTVRKLHKPGQALEPTTVHIPSEDETMISSVGPPEHDAFASTSAFNSVAAPASSFAPGTGSGKRLPFLEIVSFTPASSVATGVASKVIPGVVNESTHSLSVRAPSSIVIASEQTRNVTDQPSSYVASVGPSVSSVGPSVVAAVPSVPASEQAPSVPAGYSVSTSEYSELLLPQFTMVQAPTQTRDNTIDSDLTKIFTPVIDLGDDNLPAPGVISVMDPVMINLDDSAVHNPANGQAQSPPVPPPVVTTNLSGHSVDPPVLITVGATMPPPIEIPNRDRRVNVGDKDVKKIPPKKKSKTANDPVRSRSLLTSESQVEHRAAGSAAHVDLLAQPKYFLRIGYPDNPNIRDVIYKTDIVIGQPFLPWYNHYMYVITLPELPKLSVLPVRDSSGAFMVYPFAQGPKCGVMYVTANVGNPLHKYVLEWHESNNKQTYHAIFPAAVCQLVTIMFKLQNHKIIPKKPLYLGDLWWNKVTKTVRLDLFNIAITNELLVNHDKSFSVWGRPLLYELAKMCKLHKLVDDTIESTMANLQKKGYNLKLMGHIAYIPNMVATFRPQDPMGNMPAGSWCK